MGKNLLYFCEEKLTKDFEGFGLVLQKAGFLVTHISDLAEERVVTDCPDVLVVSLREYGAGGCKGFSDDALPVVLELTSRFPQLKKIVLLVWDVETALYGKRMLDACPEGVDVALFDTPIKREGELVDLIEEMVAVI